MHPRRRYGGGRKAAAAATVLAVLGLGACGSRTGLFVNEEPIVDGGFDAGFDVQPPRDSGREREAEPDAFDAPPDVPVDVYRNDCPDAALTFIYLVSEGRELYSYDPGGSGLRDIGPLNCPTSLSAFSMAVDRKGIAYVLFYDPQNGGNGPLFRVDTANASCSAIPQYAPGQLGFGLFGMGFSTNGGGPSETLYVEGAQDFGFTSGLASLDTTTFQLSYIGSNNPPIVGAELTGTGAGQLFAFLFYQTGGPTYLGQLDKTNGNVLNQTLVPSIDLAASAFAMGYWGGDFYFFTALNGAPPTTVTRYRPSDGSMVAVDSINDVIVGAGVSTCAPQ